MIYPVRYITYLASAISGNAKKNAHTLSNIGSEYSGHRFCVALIAASDLPERFRKRKNKLKY